MLTENFDFFPCLLITTDLETNEIHYMNQYAKGFLIDDVLSSPMSLFDFISKATAIFYESYIRPEILNSGECNEIQITLVGKKATKTPAIANVKLIGSRLYWSIYKSESRDKLYQELVSTRESLEAQTRELFELTRIDPLTSILNRRAAQEEVQSIIAKTKRSFVPTTFLMLDIDWFKDINDNYGHERGDAILVSVSRMLKTLLRETDVLARWGGEEFLIVLYNVDIKKAFSFCERIHHSLKQIKIADNKFITVSIGGVELRQEMLAEQNLFEVCVNQADIALYRSKETGRNKSTFYEQIKTA
ncbi:GGDEF domain-containing protein [Planctobacterium marinum]|uniref:diguanylate cyclase n=1 Tax=Planctobacterium marinum TaxID=1631968 RepID=A0AA48HLQ9_9ALTE|nr:hypothetical protein MACH26_26270 [Planctobacterium marinum]